MTVPNPVPERPASPWWQVPDPLRAVPLRGDEVADVAVVGGGIAGLAAAYHLSVALPGRRIVVLEARRVGAGGSGCSTGIVAPGVGGPITQLRRRYGDAVAARMFARSVDAVRCTVDLVRDEGMACDLEVNGQLVAAVTHRQDLALREQARAYADLGFDVPYLPRREVSALLRTDAYAGALRHPLAATLDPVALCRALRGRLQERGVAVYEDSPVTALVPGPPATLSTPAGRVTAGRTVLATDGFTAGLGVLTDTVVPLTAHVVRTAALNAHEMAALGWRLRDSVVDCRTFFDYYRLTPDNRIILGGGRVGVPVPGPGNGSRDGDDRSGQAAWRRLESRLRRLFPLLDDVPVTERWSGRIGAIVDRLPHVGAVPRAPGVWFTGGWCGHGIPLSVAAGADLAERIGAERGDREPVPWQRDRSPQLPRDPWRRWGLQAYVRSLDAVDRVQASVDGSTRPRAA
jgi:gamma-glutamylputrescine oxidase